MKIRRLLETTEEACLAEESKLGRRLPETFRNWLLKNNGRSLDGVSIFPVFDARSPKNTWNSISRQQEWTDLHASTSERPRPLLAFAEFGTGDAYCFDYRNDPSASEPPVVRWSHENGDCEFRASSFTEFCARLAAGEFEYD